MLKISRLADYSTVIMSFLATQGERRFSAAVIAERTKIALPTVSKVLKLLNEAALLSSTRGAAGGYQLAKPPKAISVAEIIMAIDGKPAVTQCCSMSESCSHMSECDLRGNWQMINQIILDVLYSVSLEDMQKPITRDIPIQFHGLSSGQYAKLKGRASHVD